MNPNHDEKGRFTSGDLSADELAEMEDLDERERLAEDEYGDHANQSALEDYGIRTDPKVFTLFHEFYEGATRVDEFPVDQSMLVASQPTVNRLVVDQIEEIPVDTDEPIVISIENGQHRILDGHHRMASSVMRGRETVPVLILDPRQADRLLGREPSGKIKKADGGLRFEWDDLEEIVMEEMTEAFVEGAESAAERISADVFDSVNERASAWARERSAEMVTQINETTRQAIKDLVAEGKSPAEIQEALEESYAFSAERAKTIAVTEVSMAQEAGAMQEWKESGVVTGKRWILGSEHDKDDECDENASAGTIPIDEDFPSGHEAPPAHPNCRCDVVPVLDIDEEGEDE